MRKLIFALLICLIPFIAVSDEVIVDFKEESIPVLNEEIRKIRGDIDDLQKTSGCRAYLPTTSQTIASGNWYKLTLSTESYDNQNEFDSTTNYRFTAKKAGYYLVVGSAYFLAPGDGVVVGLRFYKNGNPVTGVYVISGSAGNLIPNLSDVLYLAANDYVELFAYQLSGGNKDVSYGEIVTFLTIHKLS